MQVNQLCFDLFCLYSNRSECYHSIESGHNSATTALLQEYNYMKEQILHIISAAETRAFVHLLYRLAYISRALNQNVVIWHADRYIKYRVEHCTMLPLVYFQVFIAHLYFGICRGEYTEAQRLRNLSNAIQSTFYEQCAGSNDNDNIMNRIHSISRGLTLYF